jgi:AraC family transcriptional regulator
MYGVTHSRETSFWRGLWQNLLAGPKRKRNVGLRSEDDSEGERMAGAEASSSGSAAVLFKPIRRTPILYPMVNKQSSLAAETKVDRTLALFEDRLGPPVSLCRVMRKGHAVAAVGRWRHSGAEIDLEKLETTQLVFNVTGGQRLEWLDGAKVTSSVARCGSTAVVRRASKSKLLVSGRADTVQLVMDLAHLPSASSRAAQTVGTEAELQALSVQALVSLDASDVERLAGTIYAVAAALAAADRTSLPPASGGLTPATLRKVNDLVGERLRVQPNRLPSVKDLAEVVGLSQFHFIRAFKISVGETPHTWIALRKVDYAIRLLLEGLTSIGEAADSAGYSSPSHFISAFRQRTGVTPGQFREASLGM